MTAYQGMEFYALSLSSRHSRSSYLNLFSDSNRTLIPLISPIITAQSIILKSLKSAAIEEIRRQLNTKVEDLQSLVDSGRASRDSSTKSSAGDKHETSRALMQNEMDQNQRVLSEALTLKRDFDRIDFEKNSASVQMGSMIKTQKGTFLISVGLGRVQVADEVIFAISLASPIGRALLGAKVGDRVAFHGQRFEILTIS